MVKKIVPTMLSTADVNLINDHPMLSTTGSARAQNVEDSFTSHLSGSSPMNNLINPVPANMSRAQRSLLSVQRAKLSGKK